MLSFVYIMTPQTVVMESAWGRRTRHPCKNLNKSKILAQHIPHTEHTPLSAPANSYAGPFKFEENCDYLNQ